MADPDPTPTPTPAPVIVLPAGWFNSPLAAAVVNLAGFALIALMLSRPTPAPSPTPGPGPTPPPVVVVKTLKDLAGDGAAPLAEFYADFAGNIRAGACATTGGFRAAHQQAAATFQKAGKLPSLAPVNQPISDRLAAAIGLADVPLDAAKREALAVALDSIAAELRGK